MTDAESPGGNPPAGWYPDAEIPGGQRYWDGQHWTEHREPPPPSPVAPSPTTAPPTSNRKWLYGIAALVLVAAGIGVGLWLTNNGGNGDSTSTVGATTSSTTTSSTTTSSAIVPVGGISLQSVSECLSDAGTDIQGGGVKKFGPGEGILGIMPNGTYAGVVVAPNGAVANGLARGLSRESGFEVNTTDDPNVLVTFKGSIDDQDRQIMNDCVAQG